MTRISRLFILGAFILALLVIVFIQFNTNKNIKQLVEGNQDLIETLHIKNDLEKLQTNVVLLESRIRAAIIRGEAIDSTYLNTELVDIQAILVKLDTLRHAEHWVEFDHLKRLVVDKIRFNSRLSETYRAEGKTVAEKMAREGLAKFSVDSIKMLSDLIDLKHEKSITTLIQAADENVYQAKTWATILASLATLVCFITFGYISYKFTEQQRLVIQLNESEKKIKEVIQIKENFLANMSHEIRTPLNSILGFTDLMSKQQLEGDAHAYLGFIKQSGSGLLTLVNEILDLSKIEAGMLRIEDQPFNLADSIRFIDSMFKPRFEEKKLDWQVSSDPDLPSMVHGDAHRLNQILINIIANAHKFTESGGVHFCTRIKSQDERHIVIDFEISDSGIGIEKENLNAIFERFQQADNAVTRNYGGTGLGLTIVKKLVELLGGTIHVNSRRSEGSVFSVTLPFGIVHEDQGGHQHFDIRQDIIDTIPQTQGLVLIVEDNQINQSLLKHLFHGWHIPCFIVSNGSQAIEYLSTHPVQMILMDIQMPEMDGYTTTRHIRHHLKSKVPIIAMTAHAFDSEKEKCLHAGMNDYISKPLDTQKLYDLIAKFDDTSLPVSPQNDINKYDPQYLNLKYLEVLSAGNQEFKISVLKQCLLIIPTEVEDLDKALTTWDLESAKRIAHSMKSSLGVLGMDDNLSPFLQMIESATKIDPTWLEEFGTVKTILQKVLQEARYYISTVTIA